MSSSEKIRRGDVYYADFGATNGCEISGIRPALVISNNIGNEHGPTVIVAAITSRLKAFNMPTHIVVEQSAGLPMKSMLNIEQIRTLDKSCLKEKIGEVSEAFMLRVDRALEISVGLNGQYN